jgi:hypothetical protein
MTTKTKEEIQALKDNWIKDPCWDIEDTEGFEEHKDALRAYRLDLEEKHKLAVQARKELRLEKVRNELGIWIPETASALCTFEEIGNALNAWERYLGKEGTNTDDLALGIALEQVRATLLLAAQVQRVADLLGQKIDQDASDDNTDYMTRLYSIK